ncbi:hypothetical protein [Kribbella swartbergensis]
MRSSSVQRKEVLRTVAELVPEAVGADCVRVGVDGVDGSGKTTFANELADVLRNLGRYVVRVSVDDFHHVAASDTGAGVNHPRDSGSTRSTTTASAPTYSNPSAQAAPAPQPTT